MSQPRIKGTRCHGRNHNLSRCGRYGSWRLFCEDHKYQWLLALSFVIFTAGSAIASYYALFQPPVAAPANDWQVMDETFNGIRIGGDIQTVYELQYPRLERTGTGALKTIKWALPSQNTFTVTYDSEQNRIRYMSVDWNHTESARHAGIGNFSFGLTTLDDIRAKLGSNGFAYATNIMREVEEGILTYNAFELEDTPAITVVFTTEISSEALKQIRKLPHQEQTMGKIGRYFKLTGISVGEESYFDKAWGEDKIYDPNSRPVRLKME